MGKLLETVLKTENDAECTLLGYIFAGIKFRDFRPKHFQQYSRIFNFYISYVILTTGIESLNQWFCFLRI